MSLTAEQFYGQSYRDNNLLADIFLGMKIARFYVLEPQVSGLAARLPAGVHVKNGGPWFYIYNLSKTISMDVEDINGSTQTTIAPDTAVIILRHDNEWHTKALTVTAGVIEPLDLPALIIQWSSYFGGDPSEDRVFSWGDLGGGAYEQSLATDKGYNYLKRWIINSDYAGSYIDEITGHLELPSADTLERHELQLKAPDILADVFFSYKLTFNGTIGSGTNAKRRLGEITLDIGGTTYTFARTATDGTVNNGYIVWDGTELATLEQIDSSNTLEIVRNNPLQPDEILFKVGGSTLYTLNSTGAISNVIIAAQNGTTGTGESTFNATLSLFESRLDDGKGNLVKRAGINLKRYTLTEGANSYGFVDEENSLFHSVQLVGSSSVELDSKMQDLTGGNYKFNLETNDVVFSSVGDVNLEQYFMEIITAANTFKFGIENDNDVERMFIDVNAVRERALPITIPDTDTLLVERDDLLLNDDMDGVDLNSFVLSDIRWRGYWTVLPTSRPLPTNVNNNGAIEALFPKYSGSGDSGYREFHYDLDIDEPFSGDFDVKWGIKTDNLPNGAFGQVAVYFQVITESGAVYGLFIRHRKNDPGGAQSWGYFDGQGNLVKRILTTADFAGEMRIQRKRGRIRLWMGAFRFATIKDEDAITNVRLFAWNLFGGERGQDWYLTQYYFISNIIAKRKYFRHNGTDLIVYNDKETVTSYKTKHESTKAEKSSVHVDLSEIFKDGIKFSDSETF